jgi:hypothetical protein
VTALLDGRPVPVAETPPISCSIKWPIDPRATRGRPSGIIPWPPEKSFIVDSSKILSIRRIAGSVWVFLIAPVTARSYAGCTTSHVGALFRSNTFMDMEKPRKRLSSTIKWNPNPHIRMRTNDMPCLKACIAAAPGVLKAGIIYDFDVIASPQGIPYLRQLRTFFRGAIHGFRLMPLGQ